MYLMCNEFVQQTYDTPN